MNRQRTPTIDYLFDRGFITFRNSGDRPFRLLDGSILDVESFGDIRGLSAFSDETPTAMEIPCNGSDLAMLLIQPEMLESFKPASIKPA